MIQSLLVWQFINDNAVCFNFLDTMAQPAPCRFHVLQASVPTSVALKLPGICIVLDFENAFIRFSVDISIICVAASQAVHLTELTLAALETHADVADDYA